MIYDKIPKISCVIVTTGRVDLIKKSIYCYTCQTYNNKELVILSQGNLEKNNHIKSYVKSLGRKDVMFFDAPSTLNLGSMRNVSIEISRGEIICQWDDDDFYHPDRLKTQYNVLRRDSRNIACAYTDFLKYFKIIGEVYWCDWSGEKELSSQLLCGTIMFYKKAFYEHKNLLYPQVGEQCCVEEDLNVLQKLIELGTVAPVFGANQYVYVYHGENTYDLEHHKLTLSVGCGKYIMSAENLRHRKDMLKESFSLMNIDSPVTFRSLKEEAFIL